MNGWTPSPTTSAPLMAPHSETDAERDGQTERNHRQRVERAGAAQHHRRRHPGERVDGADREVDAARDDDDGRADGHDREEAGVGRRLDEGVGVEEVVDRQPRAGVNVGAGKGSEDAPEEKDDEHEPCLRGRQRSFEHQRPPSISAIAGTLKRDTQPGQSRGTLKAVADSLAVSAYCSSSGAAASCDPESAWVCSDAPGTVRLTVPFECPRNEKPQSADGQRGGVARPSRFA